MDSKYLMTSGAVQCHLIQKQSLYHSTIICWHTEYYLGWFLSANIRYCNSKKNVQWFCQKKKISKYTWFFHPKSSVLSRRAGNNTLSPRKNKLCFCCRSNQNFQRLTDLGGYCKYLGNMDKQNYVVASMN